ncbi:MAG: hypothetical protein COY70_04590 [Candidatus Magasanikbacteria bacterium CG_4_10_14_0_8_um_filter_42_12]|nr:MAG: hypothetical protein COY70_04590 [Candidatus Magasanikbacteria bacterium CG_4_10_14_0_8_um_filter_42_12]
MITFFSSLYKSNKYLPTYIKNLKFFSHVLIANDIDFEFLVIVNDATEKERVLKKIFGDCDWFRYMEIPREPLYATWNRAIAESTGDIIGFWHVDDVRYPEAVIEALKLCTTGADLVYFPFTIKWYINIFHLPILVKWKKIKKFDSKTFGDSMSFGPFFLFTRALYNAVGPFDEQLTIVADFDWCIRASKVAKKISLCTVEAGIFRVDGNGLSSGGKTKHTVENNIVYQRHNVLSKIEDVDIDHRLEYKVDAILCDGKWYDSLTLKKVIS